MTHSKRSPTIDLPSKEQTESAIQPYSDEDLSIMSNMDDKIKSLVDFFEAHEINYDKIITSFDDKKKAYPNFDQYIHMPGKRDTQKWLRAVKEIYYQKKNGANYATAIRHATNNWDKMEVYDFLNWLRFYEEGTHMKYKYAQVWYENGQPGYFLHIKQDEPPPASPTIDGNAVNDAREEANRNEEKKRIIEKQRQKIIGRLDSAEKLLRSPEGQMFAGPELENLMEAIYGLKKKVQLINKLSISTRLYEDMIVREANVLSRKGFTKAAGILYSVAEDAIPAPATPQDPSGAGNPGTPGTLPIQAPGVPNPQTTVNNDGNQGGQPPVQAIVGLSAPPPTAANTPPIIPQDNPSKLHPAISEFNKGMEGDDEADISDNLEVNDQEDMLLVTEAQIGAPPIDEPMTTTPPPAPGNPVPAPVIPNDEDKDAAPPTDEPLEVTEEDIPTTLPTTDFMSRMNQLMRTVTIGDIVAELEDISKAYKTREQAERLNKVAMMLTGAGLASMFPSLSEAQNKALEANNYISTRIDDILSKLRGAMASQEQVSKEPVTERPDMAGIKSQLQSDQEKEENRKKLRKEQEAAQLEGKSKETPEVEMGELAAPAPAPAPAPSTPPVPPAVPPPPARPIG